ncbi:HPr kinase/phosphorylase [Pontibaca salina]|uniref:HPr kinase/phosphatase C-terminal domain-containing protein n=1 Tax=Pontibaca salina TaxID=2795731 RepID=A0A934LZQ4_9RHOB|nr:HPr kinase/phosphatase C-terminal domain-containing protein [Pontibaca salina]MBI6629230.1 HPr kinase/phosphatase C-terminal domain-containing protein [Pontibaca salina]
MEEVIVHASCVAAHGRGLLIRGASGSGKSSLALAFMALGARLVADDRTILRRRGDRVMASAPVPIRGLIEARGIGLLNAQATEQAALDLVVDLDHTESHRLPPFRHTRLLEQELPLLYRVENIHFASMLMQYLKEGRQET